MENLNKRSGAETTVDGGGELTIAAMDEDSREVIGGKTYRFVRRVMQDPEMKKIIQARAAEIRAAAQTSAV